MCDLQDNLRCNRQGDTDERVHLLEAALCQAVIFFLWRWWRNKTVQVDPLRTLMKSFSSKETFLNVLSKNDWWHVVSRVPLCGFRHVCVCCARKKINRATHMTQKYSLPLSNFVCFSSYICLSLSLSPSQMRTLYMAYLQPNNLLWALWHAHTHTHAPRHPMLEAHSRRAATFKLA